MIDQHERQLLIDMAYSPEIYGTDLPIKVEKQWKCARCGFVDEIEKIVDHLASGCDLSYNDSVR